MKSGELEIYDIHAWNMASNYVNGEALHTVEAVDIGLYNLLCKGIRH